MSYQIHIGSNLDVLPTIKNNSVDAIISDPPYELGFMGKSWDSTGIAYNVALWEKCLRVLKPGGHLLAFGGSRTYHRMACAIEDAGFEVRDQIMWVYGSGFPKSHNIGKAVDKTAGVSRQIISERPAFGIGGKLCFNGHSKGATFKVTMPTTAAAKQWEGWGTALKPAHEPICLARKPLEGTVAANVLKWGVGGLNIDGCRVGDEERYNAPAGNKAGGNSLNMSAVGMPQDVKGTTAIGRFPANFIHDGSQEVLDLFPGEEGENAARFFYCPKASKADRNEGCEALEDKEWKTDGACIPERGDRPFNPSKNNHPTVKPTELMRYLCRLITPPGGTILDPFMGSGSTGRGAVSQGFNFIGIELSAEYAKIADARIKAVTP